MAPRAAGGLGISRLIKGGDRSDNCRAVPVSRLCTAFFYVNLFEYEVLSCVQPGGCTEMTSSLLQDIRSSSRGDFFKIFPAGGAVITLVVLNPEQLRIRYASANGGGARDFRIAAQGDMVFFDTSASSRPFGIESWVLIQDEKELAEARSFLGFPA